MTEKEKYLLNVNRYNQLMENGKNIKATGVLRKLQRQIRKYENK